VFSIVSEQESKSCGSDAKCTYDLPEHIDDKFAKVEA
jgi:hypothetical protein